jgi:NAD-dependent dihydropyrimidine dehydrogenase PreA subunit
MCEGCVDICPWKCIHMVSPDAIAEAIGHRAAGLDPSDNVLFIIDDDVCTRCALCVDRCPTGVIILGKVGDPAANGDSHTAPTATATATACASGERLRRVGKGDNRWPRSSTRHPSPTGEEKRQQAGRRHVQGSQAWNSIFRPGSIFRKGYTDSPRNRSYVIMNSVLYHLHPVKVKRHAVKVSYTLCLGGLSFFLFILLTVTGIFLMFFYRPDRRPGLERHLALQTSVTFGLLVRNMHRWGAHLMVLSVFLHMARVFYHGAYKPPREFNWVIGVVLLMLTLLLSFTGYLLPWDQLALWAVTVGTNMMGYTPVFGNQVRFVLLGGKEIGTDTLLRWYVLHVLMLPFVIVIFMAIHFWRVRKDGGISGPL